MPPLEHFNPAIDRYDRRSAARLFHALWPEPTVARSVAENLAASIRVAHSASDACWEVTMFPYGLRLNVGQVETLTLAEDEVLFLFQSPLTLAPTSGIEIRLREEPVFASVPVPSGVCYVPVSQLADLSGEVRRSHNAYVQSAASFKRSSPFKKSYSPAVLEYVETVLSIQLPRPSYASNNGILQQLAPLPDELDEVPSFLEGARYQVTVNAYERDPRARQLCIAKHGSACVICGFTFGAVYGTVAEGFIHVHHLRPLSEIGKEYEVDPIEDLRPVCPNCHAVLHRRQPAFSIDEVKAFLKPGK